MPSRARSNSPIKDGEFTIDDLARASDTTVRNIRAYQDRGILPAPAKRGRVGIYDDRHLARLRVVNQLLDRGYNIANIKELLDAWSSGHELIDILGLETAITTPFSEETPRRYSLREVTRMFGMKSLDPRVLQKAIALDVLRPDGIHFIAPSPRLVEAASEMVKAGISMEQLVDILRMLRGNVERVANELVRLVANQIDPYGPDNLPPPDDIPKLSELIWRLRPLAHIAIRAEADRALQQAANEYLGERLSHVIDHLTLQRETTTSPDQDSV